MSGGFLSRVTGLVRTGSAAQSERIRPIVSGPIVMTTSDRGSFVQTLGSVSLVIFPPKSIADPQISTYLVLG